TQRTPARPNAEGQSATSDPLLAKQTTKLFHIDSLPAKGWHGGDSALTVESYCCSWPVHGRTRAQIENYIAPSDCPGPSVRSRSGFQPCVLNRFVDDPLG